MYIPVCYFDSFAGQHPNVTYPMELCGVRGKDARRRAAELIEKVGLPASVLHRYPGMLSGGEQQRVAIARSIASGAHILLCDEPTGNLDTENSSRIIDLLLDLAHQDGYCVVVVTHDPEVVASADRVYRLVDGVLRTATYKRLGEKLNEWRKETQH